MHNDPTAYILAAAILGSALGFMSCALMASNHIRRARIDAWAEVKRQMLDLAEQARRDNRAL